MTCTNCCWRKKMCKSIPKVPGICQQCIWNGTECTLHESKKSIWSNLMNCRTLGCNPSLSMKESPLLSNLCWDLMDNPSIGLNPNLQEDSSGNPGASTQHDFYLVLILLWITSVQLSHLNLILTCLNHLKIFLEKEKKFSAWTQVDCIWANSLRVWVQIMQCQQGRKDSVLLFGSHWFISNSWCKQFSKKQSLDPHFLRVVLCWFPFQRQGWNFELIHFSIMALCCKCGFEFYCCVASCHILAHIQPHLNAHWIA